MPNNIITSFVKKTGKSEKEIESLWDKAKEIAKKEYPKVPESDDNFFKIVTGILKKSLGIEEESQASITTADTNTYKKPIVSTFKRMDDALKKKKKKKAQNEGNLLGELEFYLE